MIERLAESHKAAFGFKVIGELTADDVAGLSQQIDDLIAHHKKPIGILADLSEMHGATWAARWEEMRFLHRHTDHIARLAVVNDDEWQEISQMVRCSCIRAYKWRKRCNSVEDTSNRSRVMPLLFPLCSSSDCFPVQSSTPLQSYTVCAKPLSSWVIWGRQQRLGVPIPRSRDIGVLPCVLYPVSKII